MQKTAGVPSLGPRPDPCAPPPPPVCDSFTPAEPLTDAALAALKLEVQATHAAMGAETSEPVQARAEALVRALEELQEARRMMGAHGVDRPDRLTEEALADLAEVLAQSGSVRWMPYSQKDGRPARVRLRQLREGEAVWILMAPIDPSGGLDETGRNCAADMVVLLAAEAVNALPSLLAEVRETRKARVPSGAAEAAVDAGLKYKRLAGRLMQVLGDGPCRAEYTGTCGAPGPCPGCDDERAIIAEARAAGVEPVDG